MNRYTGKQLEHDLVGLNEKLERLGDQNRLVVGYRYGYTAIDLATPEQMERHCIARHLDAGTARHCLAACNAYVVGAIA